MRQGPRSPGPHMDHDKYRDRMLGVAVEIDLDRRIHRQQRLRREIHRNPQRELDYPLGITLPVGFNKGDATLTIQPTSSSGYARYIGRAVPGLKSLNVMYRVLTVAAGVNYAEIGLCFSEPVNLAAGLSDNTMTMVGEDAFVDISAAILGTGRKVALIDDIPEVNYGAHLWLLVTIQASPPPILRGGLPQEAGLMMSKAGSARPSTLATNAAFSEVSTSTNDIWLPHQMLQA